MTINRERLKAEAEKAIASANTSPFTKALGLSPVVQVKSPVKIDNFRCKHKFVGFTQNGEYIYNLDAVGVLQALTYQELEFDIN